MVDNIGNGQERLKDIVEKEAEEQQQDDYIDEPIWYGSKDKIGVRRNTRKII